MCIAKSQCRRSRDMTKHSSPITTARSLAPRRKRHVVVPVIQFSGRFDLGRRGICVMSMIKALACLAALVGIGRARSTAAWKRKTRPRPPRLRGPLRQRAAARPFTTAQSRPAASARARRTCASGPMPRRRSPTVIPVCECRASTRRRSRVRPLDLWSRSATAPSVAARVGRAQRLRSSSALLRRQDLAGRCRFAAGRNVGTGLQSSGTSQPADADDRSKATAATARRS